MPRMSTFRFTTADGHCEVSLSWDDASFAQGSIRFEVCAARYRHGDPRPATATAAVSLGQHDGGRLALTVEVGGTIVGSILLADLFDEDQVSRMISSGCAGSDVACSTTCRGCARNARTAPRNASRGLDSSRLPGIERKTSAARAVAASGTRQLTSAKRTE